MNRFRRLAVFPFLFAFAFTTAIAAATEVVTVSSATSNLASGTTDNDSSNNDNYHDSNNDNIDDNIDDDDDNGNSFNMHYNYIPHEGNSTLSATFSIRVTPEHYHMLSWTILWTGFVSAVLLGMHQVRLEKRWLKHVLSTSTSRNSGASRGSSASRSQSRLRKYSVLSGSNTNSPQDSELGGNNNNNNGSGMRTARGKGIVRSNRGGSRMTLSSSTASLTNSSNPANLGDEQPVSSGDLARAAVSCTALRYRKFVFLLVGPFLSVCKSACNLFEKRNQ